jgi:hypothetical protein
MTLFLSDQQKEYIKGLAKQLPPDKRETFTGAVHTRLCRGHPSDATTQRVASLIFRELQRGELIARRA